MASGRRLRIERVDAMDRDDRPPTEGTGSDKRFDARRVTLYSAACGLLLVAAALTAGHLIGRQARGPEEAPLPAYVGRFSTAHPVEAGRNRSLVRTTLLTTNPPGPQESHSWRTIPLKVGRSAATPEQ